MPGLLMHSLLSETISNNTDNCTDGVKWIYNVLKQCVQDTKGYTAVIMGIVSIFAWAINGLPQMIENCKSGLAHQGMSIYLLIFWTIGDNLNLVGCLLTNQLPLQTYMAVFSIFCDIILLSQWIAAYLRHSRRCCLRTRSGDLSPDSAIINSEASAPSLYACVATVWLFNCGAAWSAWLPSGPAPAVVSAGGSGRKLLFYQPVFVSTEDLIGYIMGCLSSCCYLSARIPQLTKNFLRRSTQGLSMGLFALALVGNATYSAQIFLTDTSSMFILKHLPWILGSLGVMSLDIVMLGQFIAYRHKSPMQLPITSAEEDCTSDDEKNLIHT